MVEWEHEVRKNNKGDFLSESWTYQKHNMKAIIVHGHVYYPDGYVLHCELLNIDTQVLSGTTLEEVQDSAYNLLVNKSSEMLKSLRDFL